MPKSSASGMLELNQMVLASIDILLPSLLPVIGEWYSKTPSADDGMPPHCTLLYPWRRSEMLRTDLEQLRQVASSFGPIQVELRGLGRFPNVALYLVPEPGDILCALMRAIWKAFPDSPPYEGAFGLRPAPVPHVTVAKGTDGYLNEVEPLVRARVLARPLEVQVREICVSVDGAAPGGKWTTLHRVALSHAAGR
jgi:2'-5' RNA ligase